MILSMCQDEAPGVRIPVPGYGIYKPEFVSEPENGILYSYGPVLEYGGKSQHCYASIATNGDVIFGSLYKSGCVE